jgi:hypothetical protein
MSDVGYTVKSKQREGEGEHFEIFEIFEILGNRNAIKHQKSPSP